MANIEKNYKMYLKISELIKALNKVKMGIW